MALFDPAWHTTLTQIRDHYRQHALERPLPPDRPLHHRDLPYTREFDVPLLPPAGAAHKGATMDVQPPLLGPQALPPDARAFLDLYGFVVLNPVEGEEASREPLSAQMDEAVLEMRQFVDRFTAFEDEPYSKCYASRRAKDKNDERLRASLQDRSISTVMPWRASYGELAGFRLPAHDPPPAWYTAQPEHYEQLPFHTSWQGQEAVCDPLGQAECMWRLRERLQPLFAAAYGRRPDALLALADSPTLVYPRDTTLVPPSSGSAGEEGTGGGSGGSGGGGGGGGGGAGGARSTMADPETTQTGSASIYASDMGPHWMGDVREQTDGGRRPSYRGMLTLSEDHCALQLAVGQHQVAPAMLAQEGLVRVKRSGELRLHPDLQVQSVRPDLAAPLAREIQGRVPPKSDAMSAYMVPVRARRGRLVLWNSLCMHMLDHPTVPQSPWQLGLFLQARPTARQSANLVEAHLHAYQHHYRMPFSGGYYQQFRIARTDRFTLNRGIPRETRQALAYTAPRPLPSPVRAHERARATLLGLGPTGPLVAAWPRLFHTGPRPLLIYREAVHRRGANAPRTGPPRTLYASREDAERDLGLVAVPDSYRIPQPELDPSTPGCRLKTHAPAWRPPENQEAEGIQGGGEVRPDKETGTSTRLERDKASAGGEKGQGGAVEKARDDERKSRLLSLFLEQRSGEPRTGPLMVHALTSLQTRFFGSLCQPKRRRGQTPMGIVSVCRLSQGQHTGAGGGAGGGEGKAHNESRGTRLTKERASDRGPAAKSTHCAFCDALGTIRIPRQVCDQCGHERQSRRDCPGCWDAERHHRRLYNQWGARLARFQKRAGVSACHGCAIAYGIGIGVGGDVSLQSAGLSRGWPRNAINLVNKS